MATTAALPTTTTMATEKKVLEPEEPEVKEEGTGAGAGAAAAASVVETEVKHNLQNTWKIWYFENMKDKSWEDCLRVVSPFHTVEDFWSVFNHIKSASDIRTGGSYYVFKDGIKPMWEDEANRKGGRWLMSFNKQQRHSLDGLWLEVLLCLIGEAFDDDGDDVCGAVVDIRGKQDRISIWTADCKNKERIMNIGRKIKERLSLHNGLMSYESHEATAVKSGSSVKSLFTL